MHQIQTTFFTNVCDDLAEPLDLSGEKNKLYTCSSDIMSTSDTHYVFKTIMTKEDWHQIIDAVHCTSKKILAGMSLRAVGCHAATFTG